MNFLTSLIISLCCILPNSVTPTTIKYRQHAVDQNSCTVTIDIALTPQEQIYKETLDLSINSPDAAITSWNVTKDYQKLYVESLKTTKLIYADTVPVIVQVKRTEPACIAAAELYIRFVTSKHGPEEHVVPVIFSPLQEATPYCPPATQEEQKSINVLPAAPTKTVASYFGGFSLSDYVANLTQKTESLWVRLLLVFIMGILVSFTPCIYPMIPITVGILQAQASNSLFRNILTSLSYTFGIATTFAFFGLAASFTGPVYGYLLGNPFFVLFLVFILGYLGFSMLGFYDMHILSFMQPSGNNTANSGSLLSVFLFGAASGTIASPCVSPGLMLLLSIVATISNPLLGFLLLFTFGLGLSTPLLIIGTFSSSLSIMPRAGMWMIEVKRFFGFLLLGMCLYYLNNILPWHYTLWLAGSGTTLAGLHYLWMAQNNRSSWLKKINSICGIALIIASVIICTNAYQEMMFKEHDIHNPLWQKDYDAARAQAQQEHKPMLLDFWATYCSLCKEIDTNLFMNPTVQLVVNDLTVPVKINGTQPQQEPYATLRKQYHVTGLPLYILVDPETGSLVKQWNSQLYCVTPETFIQELSTACQAWKDQ